MRRSTAASWRDVDKRMRRVVQLRQQGLSHRQIAKRLVVSHTTVRRDLERFERENVAQLLEHLGGTYGPPEVGMFQSDVPE